jgi:hypothetical protein
MARLLFATLEVWAVLLILLLMSLGTIAFGFLVLDGTRSESRFGAVSDAAVSVAEIPDTVQAMLDPPDRVRIWNSARFASKPTGWSTPRAAMPEISGYILFSHYDGTIRRHKVELVSMQDWQTKHTWMPDGAEVLQDAEAKSGFIDFSTWNSELFRAIHPLLLPDGNLIVKDHFSPIMRVDACSRRVWLNDDRAFHHSTEMDDEGYLWVPSLVEPQQIAGVLPEFSEDEIVKLNTDGNILFSRSVPQLMLDHRLEYLIFTNGSYGVDPTHLNDIEFVKSDGPFWKRGDLFLSLRNISTIMLYRPSTDRIVWWKQGPWVAQHDVDVLDDHRISIYDNHAEDRGRDARVLDHSDVVIYDFAADTASRPYAELMISEKIRTTFAGLYAELPGGYALIEDVTDARLMIAGPDGKLAAEYVNRAESGDIYQLGWSRYIDQATGDRVLSALQGVNCDG